MKYTVGIIIVVLLLFFVGLYQVSNNQKSEEAVSEAVEINNQQKLSVATSFYPLQFALERILGDLGMVTNIGEGKDPHDFKPTTQDILTLQKADLVVLQGVDFEPWGDDVIARLEADDVSVFIATDNLELHEGGHQHDDESGEEEVGVDEHDHGAYDPHTWLDPVLFSEMVTSVTEEIIAIDKNNAAVYLANAAVLQADLVELDTKYKTTLARCEFHELITSHAAFGYVADRYNFAAHSIAGLSTQDSPSVTTLAELKEEAKEGIEAILLEENSIAAYGETLARETGLRTLSINPISYAVPTGENYLTLMEKNLDAFATALKCNE